MFQDAPLLFMGMAPPALEKNAAANRTSFIAS
jgi:hypothetical protein